MNRKTVILTAEERLLQSRKENLAHVHGISSLQAQGKLFGMDAFSWKSPEADALINWLKSIPYPVVWLGKKEQIEGILELETTLVDVIETLIVYDGCRLNISDDHMKNVENITCVGDFRSALELIKAFRNDRRMLLLTCEKEEIIERYKSFIASF